MEIAPHGLVEPRRTRMKETATLHRLLLVQSLLGCKKSIWKSIMAKRDKHALQLPHKSSMCHKVNRVAIYQRNTSLLRVKKWGQTWTIYPRLGSGSKLVSGRRATHHLMHGLIPRNTDARQKTNGDGEQDADENKKLLLSIRKVL